MVDTRFGETQELQEQPVGYDRVVEMKAFDNSKVEVKGISYLQPAKIPKFFIQKNLNLARINKTDSTRDNNTILVINMKKEVVDKIRDASEKWRFFQIIEHDIPNATMTELIKSVKRFHEENSKLKIKIYSDIDGPKKSSIQGLELFCAPGACWRDTVACSLIPGPLDPQELPKACSMTIFLDYCKKVQDLGVVLFELFSEALGLSTNFFKNIDCAEVVKFLCHNYPPCPEPELTLGGRDHSDHSVITILLKDHIGGLQIWLGSEWFDVDPIPGALVVNLGDLMQLITKKFISSRHRILAKCMGPRISAACFLKPHYRRDDRYGPLKELIMEENPPIYKETTIKEFLDIYFAQQLEGTPMLEHLMI